MPTRIVWRTSVPRLRQSLPVLHSIVGCTPSECLGRQRRIASAAGPHHRSAEDTQIGNLVRKAPAVHNIRFGIVAHTGATVCVSCKGGYARFAGFDCNGARLAKPLVDFLMGVTDGTHLVLLGSTRGDSAYWIA